MKGSTQVNCFRRRHIQRAKDAVRLLPKRHCSRLLPLTLGARGHTRLSAYQAGIRSSVLFIRNIVNLSSRPSWAGATARYADGVSGRGFWRKPMPLCNRADRSCNITPLRKQADFQMVVRYERTCKIFIGGKANER